MHLGIAVGAAVVLEQQAHAAERQVQRQRVGQADRHAERLAGHAAGGLQRGQAARAAAVQPGRQPRF